MTIREEIRRLAEEACSKEHIGETRYVESAILEGVKLVLARLLKEIAHDEETAKLALPGWEEGYAAGIRSTDAMTQELLKELE